ncbi:hypothetical protein GIB67_007740 [Kingdonia uniflora]|uniref:Mitochondrial substrate carrier family protein n=1 Tax=Kingdonia uniflora TaxID=39325 RepID=A0A7J7N1M9_9MAGN|nr:hypothetical protein GIB67_007740 [Kingdonia uniflora]
MQTEARVGVVVEGGQRSLNSGHGGGVIDGTTARNFSQQQKQHSLHQQSQIGTVAQLLAGGVAGAVSKTCTAPLARLTILFQIQGMHSDVATLRKASILREASRIVGEEGFTAFWKGNLVTIAHRLPYSSLSFYAYERYKNVSAYALTQFHFQAVLIIATAFELILIIVLIISLCMNNFQLLQSIPGLESHRENVAADLFVRLVAGGMSGVTAASMTYPLDLVRTRLAAQTHETYYKGIGHTLRTICRDEGFFGLYKGLGATLLGVGPSIAISFSVYETLRSSWQIRRPQDSTILVSLACGSLSGIASSTATFPLDLVRRRMQLEGAGGRARVYNTGLFGTFRHIVRNESLRGLYRGIVPEYYKVVPSVGIVFMTYETMKMLLAEYFSSN